MCDTCPLTIEVRAKVNLYLRVVGRREDGYHEVETVLQSIGLADGLTFAPAEGLRLECDQPGIPTGVDNLVWKAAAALRERCGLPPERGAAITIRKRIPAGAGLGGGSADAAAALVGLARLWELAPGPGELYAVASELGSDVPFFLAGGAALARGRGEQLQPLPNFPAIWLVVAKPPFQVSTPWAYHAWRPEADSGPALQGFLAAMATGSAAAIAACLRNDLEPGVDTAHPEIAALRGRLLDLGALGARMTGSGSAVFAVTGDEAEARRIATGVDPAAAECFVVRTLGPSPPTARPAA
jgi:4-diphosphocytidyl-2-C-methyl-D-erythritol kinase